MFRVHPSLLRSTIPLLAIGFAACAHHAPAAAPVPQTGAASATTKTATASDSSTKVTPAAAHPRQPDRPASLADLPVLDATASPFYTMNRMDWPGPNEYRDASGSPGPAYWQQRADYEITATLDTGAHTITGAVTVTYTNNSPDTLRFVWMQVDQNIYEAHSEGAALFGPTSRNAGAGYTGGYTLREVRVNGAVVTPEIHNTMMRVDLPAPLHPHGGKLTIAIQYAFPVLEHGSDRMGRDGALYEIAQWYPRMAVYDDVRGWNVDQYLGAGEFYLEYGDIDYSVTVPAGYIVGGSGVLQNASDVLSDTVRHRLAQASTSSDVVQVITEAEAAARAKPVAGTKTWHFRAHDVRDVAWAGAPDFRWDATSARGVLCQALYEWPKAGPEWPHVAEGDQWTIRTYSELLQPYPYPVATSVAGTVSGMEYPMFVMDGYTDTDRPGDVFRTNDHEQGHEWFPMVVGSNERRYAWMDEGLNTYINAFSQERRYGVDVAQWPRGMDNWSSFMQVWSIVVRANLDVPIMTAPDHITEMALGSIGYDKPAAVLLALRDHVVGPEAMDLAMKEYVRRWSFKHPTPGDFFRTVENVSGRDLSWFWREFFYQTALLDIGIDSVTSGVGGSADAPAITTVRLHRFSPAIFPVELRLKFADGTTQDVNFPVDIWAHGETYTAQIATSKQVIGARLWPNRVGVPDVDARNDTWGDAPAADPPGVATGGGLASTIPPTAHQ